MTVCRVAGSGHGFRGDSLVPRTAPIHPWAAVWSPAAPTGAAATDNADGTATVTWTDASADEDGFEVQREEQHRNGSWRKTEIVATTAADATSVTDASGAGTFRYRVRAFNSSGTSAWTSWAVVDVTGGSDGGGGPGNGGGNPNRP